MLNEDLIRLTRRQLTSPLVFRLSALKILPMVFFAGIRVVQCDEHLCEVRLRYSWLVRNPFRSTFWAVLGMAAELATGALLVAFTRNQTPKVSFILVAEQGNFFKKGRGRMRFICNHSGKVRQAVLTAMQDHEKHEIKLPVRALNADGELIAEMEFTWVLQQRH